MKNENKNVTFTNSVVYPKAKKTYVCFSSETTRYGRLS